MLKLASEMEGIATVGDGAAALEEVAEGRGTVIVTVCVPITVTTGDGATAVVEAGWALHCTFTGLSLGSIVYWKQLPFDPTCITSATVAGKGMSSCDMSLDP